MSRVLSPQHEYETECPITLHKITRLKSYIVLVETKKSNGEAVKQNQEKQNQKVWFSSYYIYDKNTLLSLKKCPYTRLPECRVCKLSELGDEQLNFLLSVDGKSLKNLSGKRLAEKDQEMLRMIAQFPWKNQTFGSKVSVTYLDEYIERQRIIARAKILLVSFLLIIAGIPLVSCPAAVVVTGALGIVFFLMAFSIVESFQEYIQCHPRLDNHATYSIGDIQNTLENIIGLNLDSVAAKQFIKAVCKEYDGVMRRHRYLQTFIKLLTIGFWNHVSRSSKGLYQSLQNDAVPVEAKLDKMKTYVSATHNQGKSLFTIIVQHGRNLPAILILEPI